MVALACPIHHREQPSMIHPGPSPPIAEQDLALGAAISDVRAAKQRTRISCNNAIREAALSFSTSAGGKLQRVLALASEREELQVG